MSAGFRFQHRVEFRPEIADEVLRGVPAAPGVFALRGEREGDQPYLTRAADMRRRMRRLLASPEAVDEQGRPVLSKRLDLRGRVRWIEWTRTGSELESSLVLYRAARAAFGAEEARRRLRLYPPYFLRVTSTHEHPRVYATNRLGRRAMSESFGPFPSRAAAERYADAVLDLFKLRRCHEDLQVHPEHPGCAYGEMNKCLAPCKGSCSAEDYANEARGVLLFFTTHGASLLDDLAAKREAASEAMDFEAAATLHKQWERVKAAASLSDELARPLAELRAVVLQEAAPREDGEKLDEAAVFLLKGGKFCGPERLSTLGVRAVREQTAVGSSLFAQPLMLSAVPEEQGLGSREKGIGSRDQGTADTGEIEGQRTVDTAMTATLSPEERARAVVAKLHEEAEAGGAPDISGRADVLALFRRWYYRPEKQRAGEVFLPNADSSWPIRRILNGAARIVLGAPGEMQPVDREAFKGMKTKVLHEGREGVERVVPVLPKRSRSRKSMAPSALLDPAGER